ncbi:hypothetical protein [Chitinophaga cymbidii]|uniref:Uncharacterized protein n=1 Tax=Chitinophaga cymbidii TaxID=1096750 RepID=A0A512RIN5_9BACT|nr:hypothetical protein [Chitinophaga cymbidii]GEP95558.1 hypothetical protein CCY01nite_18180 [Chitinophaga cymbidii]
MNAKEFLKSKGQLVQPKVRFLNAGTPSQYPLEDLLEEYAVAVMPAVPVYDIDPLTGQEAKASGKLKASKDKAKRGK